MKNLSPIEDDKDVMTKEYVDPVKSQAAINRTTLGTQCKNLLKNIAKSTSYSDVKFAVNSDGTVDVSSTTKSTATRFLVIDTLTLDPGSYVLTGADDLAGYGDIRVYVDSDVYQYNTPFTITESKTVVVRICVYTNRTLPNTIRVYPMLRYADITDSTYEPYQPSLIDRCLLKDTAGIALGATQGGSITIDNLSSYTALWLYVVGNVSGINFATNLIVPIAYLAKNTSNSVQLAGGIPSSAYITSEGVLAAKYMDGTITAKINGNTLSLAIGTGTIASIEVVSLM